METYYNPYGHITRSGTWLRSSFHIHPGKGDEILPLTPENIFHVYRKAGYNVLMFSGQGEWFDLRQYAESFGVHMICGTEFIRPDGILLIGSAGVICGTAQQAVDECRSQGGVCVICHPNWQSEKGLPAALSPQERETLTGVDGIEIVTACINDRFLGSGYAVDVWSSFLDAGRKIWAFANDDFHEYHDAARAWNMVYLEGEYNEKAFLDSLRNGSFYCSTGLKLYDYTFDGGSIFAVADDPVQRHGKIWYRFYGDGNTLLFETFGESGAYTLSGDETYVRMEATGGNGAKLWTQPLLKANSFT